MKPTKTDIIYGVTWNFQKSKFLVRIFKQVIKSNQVIPYMILRVSSANIKTFIWKKRKVTLF